MTFDALTIIAIVLIIILVLCWIFYCIYTNAIIKDLIKDNVRLETDNKNLKNLVAALRKAHED